MGTPFATSSYYQYTVSPTLNQVLVTAANGLQGKVIIDGAGRQLMSFAEDISTNGKAVPGHWVLKNSITYNQYGRSGCSVYLSF